MDALHPLRGKVLAGILTQVIGDGLEVIGGQGSTQNSTSCASFSQKTQHIVKISPKPPCKVGGVGLR